MSLLQEKTGDALAGESKMKRRTKVVLKYFLIRKAKEVIPIVLWIIAVFTPMIIAETFFGYDFTVPCNWYVTPCYLFSGVGLRIPFLLLTLLIEFTLFKVIKWVINWLKVNWWLADLDYKNELARKRRLKKKAKK